ncbi:MAG TPA: hypothetical protein DCG54_07400 [Anaerolineae bacterium]|jgi:hypothetical protein|nr:hypothetical protein [Anaerolineae bacterium]
MSLLHDFLLKSFRQDTSPKELISTKTYNLELGLILLEHIEGQLNRSDAKAQFTLAANTIILGVSVVLSEQGIASKIFESSAGIAERLIGVLSIVLYFCLLHSTIFSLTAVMPKFDFPAKADNIFYFGSILGTPETAFSEKIKDLQAEELNEMLISEIYVLSSIAKTKFTKIKKSHKWLILAIAAWAIIQGIKLFS